MAGIVIPSQQHVVMGFKLKKCPHSPEVNAINSFPGHWTVEDLYGDIHNIASKGSTFEACGFKDIMSGGITFNIGQSIPKAPVRRTKQVKICLVRCINCTVGPFVRCDLQV